MTRTTLLLAALAAALPAAAQTGPLTFCDGRVQVQPGSRPGQAGSAIQYFALVSATGPGSVSYTLSFTPPPPAMGAPPIQRLATQERGFVIIGGERRDAPAAPPSVPYSQMARYIAVTCH